MKIHIRKLDQGIFFLVTIVFFMLITTLHSCKSDDASPNPAISFPSHFPNIQYHSPNNTFSKDAIELGKYLFYDKNLSLSRTISCGSCHAQVHGFSDHNLSRSFGIYNRQGKRNSPAIFNLAWNPSFMWDGGINHLDVMPLGPLTDTNEMGLPIQTWIYRVKEQPRYSGLFQKAFGDTQISEKRALFALSQFMLTIQSYQSNYDKMLQNKYTFTSNEAAGYILFKKHCNACHSEPLFTNYQYKRNGFTTAGNERGRMRITELPEDLYKFKVPSLRNLEFTYPYLHDGSVFNLTDVIQKYNQIDASDEHPSINNLNFSDTEIQQLIAFLNTLNDYTLLGNKALSEPR